MILPSTELQMNAAWWAEVVRRIVAVAQPDKIILFGSRARGTARPGSDVDLLIVADSTQPRFKRAARFYGALRDLPVPMDILVFTPQEIREWSGVRQAFVTTAVREGKVLYENQS